MNPLFLRYLKDGKDMFLIDSNDNINIITFVKFPSYSYGYGFLMLGDNRLHSINSRNINNIYLSREDAENSLYNLFTVGNF